MNKLDFMQEGHRFDFIKNDKSQDQIVLKGIVYNEMKGSYELYIKSSRSGFK